MIKYLICGLTKFWVLCNPVIYQIGLNEYPNPTDGPIDSGTNTIQYNTLQTLTDNGNQQQATSFTISGFFQPYQSQKTRLLYTLPADTTGTRFIIAVYINSSGLYTSFGGVNEILCTMASTVNINNVFNQYVFISTSFNIKNYTIHQKIVYWPSPGTKSQVVFTQKNFLYTDTKGLMNFATNQQMSLVNYMAGCAWQGYFGKLRYLRVLMNFFSNEYSTNTYWDMQEIFMWKGFSAGQNQFSNELSQTYNLGVSTSQVNFDHVIGAVFVSYLQPSSGSSSSSSGGNNFYGVQKMYIPKYTNKLILPNDRLTFSCWFKISFNSTGSALNRGRFDPLYFATSQFNPTFQVAIIQGFQSDILSGYVRPLPSQASQIGSSTQLATIAINITNHLQYGKYVFITGQFYRLTLRVYTSYNLNKTMADIYIDNFHLTGGDALVWDYAKACTNFLLSSTCTTQIFTGQAYAWAGWGNGYGTMNQVSQVQVHDYRLFSGSFISFNNTQEGCDVQIGGIVKNCVLCSQVNADITYTGDGTNQNCQETRSYQLWQSGKANTPTYLCGSGQYYKSGQSEYPCTLYTQSNNVYRATSTTVLSCDPGFTLNNNQCQGSYASFCQNINTVTCQRSYDSLTGTITETSISCATGYYLLNGNCQSSCGSCLTCKLFYPSSKASYVGCLSCNSGFFLDPTSNTCVTEPNCPGTNKYHDYVNNYCQSTCPVGTMILSYDAVNQCLTKCPAQIYNISIGQQCFSIQCANGTYALNGQCKPCVSQCTTCFGGSYMMCMTCSDGYYLLNSICGTQCSSPYGVKSKFNNSCVSWCSPYQTVLEPNAPYCATTCPSNFTKHYSSCVTSQPAKTFLSPTPGQGYLACNAACISCFGSATNCSVCAQGYYLYGGISCVTTCPSTTFTNVVGLTCVTSCPSNLITIDIPAPNFLRQCALVCPQSSGVQLYLLGTGCVADCGLGYFKDAASTSCLKCNVACTSCSGSATTCYSCSDNFYYYNLRCLSTCDQSNGVLYLDSVNHICQTQCPSELVIVPAGPLCLSTCPTTPLYYLYNTTSTCLTSQPLHTFCTNLTCYDCDPKCSNCTGLTPLTCTQCYPNTFLYQSQCVDDCVDPYFEDEFNWICQTVCPQTLWIKDKSCLGSCNSTDYRYNNRFCLQAQPDQTYCTGQGGLDCADCAKACHKCTGSLSTQCQQCNPNYYLTGQACQTTCDNSIYYSDKTQWLCSTKCPSSAFIYPANKSCDSQCSMFSYVNQSLSYCYMNCPDSTYASSDLCHDCDSRCVLCTGPSNTNCQKCSTNYYLSFGNTCSDTCLDTTLIWMNTINTACESRCPSGLYKLIGTLFKCVQTCPNGMFQYFNQSQCVVSCPPFTFQVDRTVMCYDCYYTCATCYGTALDQCYTCRQGYFKEQSSCVSSCSTKNPFLDIDSLSCLPKCNNDRFAELSLKQCYKSCPKLTYFIDLTILPQCLKQCFDGYFGSMITQHCQPCAPQCAKCYDETSQDCTVCKIILHSTYNYLLGTSCQDFCPADMWKDQVNLACQVQCPTGTFADPSSSACIAQCPNVFLDSVCYDLCPFNYFQYVDQSCQSCYPGCTMCTDGSQSSCIGCNQTLLLNSKGQCSVACDKSSPYADPIERICLQDCQSPKFLEVSNKYCHIQCPAILYVDIQSCVIKCPLNKYADQFKFCQPCNGTCSSCYGPQNYQCNSCQNGYFLEVTTCTSNCSSIYFYYDIVNNICQYQCPDNLHSLVDAQQKRWCISLCPQTQPYQLGTKCLTSCPDTTYNQNNICQPCSQGCAACLDSTQYTCTKCIKGYYYNPQSKQCLTECPLNLFQDEVNFQCLTMCLQTTYSLNYARPSCIAACQNDYFIYNQGCYLECPQNTYQSGKLCLGCAFGCSSCDPTNLQSCSSCLPGFYLEQSSCPQKCSNPIQYWDQVNWVCQDQCPSNTIEYTYPPIYKCVSKCPNGYFRYKGKCVTTCPTNTYRPSVECFDCSKECLLCYGQLTTQCTLCDQGYYLTGTSCSAYCQNGWLQNPRDKNCVPECPKDLLTLNTTSLRKCVQQCPQSPTFFFQYQNKCVLNCQPNTYQVNSVCQDCAAECTRCYGGSRSQCTDCSQGYYLDQSFCADFCPQARPYKNTITLTCVANCPIGSVIVVNIKECHYKCPQGYLFYQSTCVTECPPSYYTMSGSCQSCYPSCSSCTGSASTQCTSCNTGFFLYLNSCLNQCPDNSRWNDLVNNVCRDACPIEMSKITPNYQCVQKCFGFYKYLDQQECLSKCPDGTYTDEYNTCQPCRQQCLICSGPTSSECTKCSPNYFLYQSTCASTCPPNFYRNSLNWTCTNTCPVGMLIDKIAARCTFSCDGNYFDDPDSGSCVEQCPQNRYPYMNKCELCSIECDGCFGPSNQDCKKCKDQYPYKQGMCSGDCPSIGYTKILNQCMRCSFKCINCKTTQDNCLKCRGDRNPKNQCECQDGYFDDGQNDLCQKCSNQCLTCSSFDVCTSCHNNQIGSGCFCLRQTPPNNINWCVSCQVAFITVRFSSNIDIINIDMGHSININSPNPYYPSEQNCLLLFSNETLQKLGLRPTCYLQMDTQQILFINLGQNATVNINDSIIINQNMVMDISDPSCRTFIQKFFVNTVQQPIQPQEPMAVFQYPRCIYCLCEDLLIKILHRNSSGMRPMTIQSWTILDIETNDTSFDINQHRIQLQFMINQASSFLNSETLKLQANILKNYCFYKFQVTYTNFLNHLGQSSVQFTTGDQQTPMVIIGLDPIGNSYFVSKELIIPIYVQNYRCQSALTNVTDEAFSAQIRISLLEDNTELFQNLFDIAVGVTEMDYIIDAFTFTPEVKYLISVDIVSTSNPVRKSSDIISFNFKQSDFEIQFNTIDRLVGTGQDSFKISVSALDPDVQNPSLQQLGFQYEWICTNLINLQNCQYSSGQTIVIDQNSQFDLTIHGMIFEITYAFFSKISKGSTFQVKSQIIALTSRYDIQEIPFTANYDSPQQYINPTSEITTIFPLTNNTKVKNFYMIVYDWNIIAIQPIQNPSFRIRLVDYRETFDGSNKVIFYFIPSNQSIPMFLNEGPKPDSLIITPSEGYSLTDKFNITLKFDTSQVNNINSSFTYYYYFTQSTMDQDTQEFQHTGGFQIDKTTDQTSILTYLPSGITVSSTIYVLVRIQNGRGAISYISQQVTVYPHYNTVKDTLLQCLVIINKPYNDIKQVLFLHHLTMIELNTFEDYSCYKDCSGFGTCQSIGDSQCTCIMGKALADCSGTNQDISSKQAFVKALKSTVAVATKALTPEDDFLNTLVIDIQQYILKNQISFSSTTANYSDIARLIQDSNLFLQALQNQLIDYQNSLGKEVQEGGDSSITTNFDDISQVTNQDQLFGYFEVYGRIFQLTKSKLKSKSNETNELNQININLFNSVQLLVDTLIQIKLPGQPITAAKTNNLGTAVYRAGWTQISSYLRKNISMAIFDQNLSPINRYQKIGQRELSTASEYFDFLFIQYDLNPYTFSSEFPYPGQNYIVQNLDIRQFGRKENYAVNQTLIFDFPIKTTPSSTLICIQLSSLTNLWVSDTCKTYIGGSNLNKEYLIQCACNTQDPTTIIDDIDYKYLIRPLNGELLLPKSLIYSYFSLFSTIWFVLLVYGLIKDFSEGSRIKKKKIEENAGNGDVTSIIRSKKRTQQQLFIFVAQSTQEGKSSLASLSAESSQVASPTSPKKINYKRQEKTHDFNQLEQVLNYAKNGLKYSCDNFHYQHGLLQVIFRYKFNNPRWYRITQIYSRYNFMMAGAGLFSLLDFNIYIDISVIFSGLLFVHFFEYQQTKVLLDFRKTQYAACGRPARFILTFIMLMSSLFLLTYTYDKINDPRTITDWIIVIGYSVLLDQIPFEILRFSVKRMASGESEQELIQKLREIKEKRRKAKSSNIERDRAQEIKQLKKILESA